MSENNTAVQSFVGVRRTGRDIECELTDMVPTVVRGSSFFTADSHTLVGFLPEGVSHKLCKRCGCAVKQETVSVGRYVDSCVND